MITGIRGVLEAAGPDWVAVAVGGVTLRVYVPSSLALRLGEPGAAVALHTELRIREEQPVLYGFPDAASVQLFGLLTGVSGVGPRLALGLLSALEPAGLQLAVATGDVAALSTAPGVGRRTASRIILELKGKLDPDDLGGIAPMPAGGTGEALAALTALGYSAAEAKAALDNLPQGEDLSIEERIRLALQQFAAWS